MKQVTPAWYLVLKSFFHSREPTSFILEGRLLSFPCNYFEMGWNVIPLRNTFLPNKKGEPHTQDKSSTKCHILARVLCSRETPCGLGGLEQFPHQLPIFKASNAVELLYICFIACFNFVFSNIFLFLLSKCWRLNQNIFLNESVNLTFHTEIRNMIEKCILKI